MPDATPDLNSMVLSTSDQLFKTDAQSGLDSFLNNQFKSESDNLKIQQMQQQLANSASAF